MKKAQFFEQTSRCDFEIAKSNIEEIRFLNTVLFTLLEEGSYRIDDEMGLIEFNTLLKAISDVYEGIEAAYEKVREFSYMAESTISENPFDD